MRVRITAVDGYTSEVPKSDPRFTWHPPTEAKYRYALSDSAWVEDNFARVYAELTTLDDLVALVSEYGPIELKVRDAEDDIGMLEVVINHDCHAV